MTDKKFPLEKVFKEARIMLCNYLRDQAIEKKISQEEIASKTGFTQSNVSRMLSGKYPPTLDNFMKLAVAVDCYFFIENKLSGSNLTTKMKDRWMSSGDLN